MRAATCPPNARGSWAIAQGARCFSNHQLSTGRRLLCSTSARREGREMRARGRVGAPAPPASFFRQLVAGTPASPGVVCGNRCGRSFSNCPQLGIRLTEKLVQSARSSRDRVGNRCRRRDPGSARSRPRPHGTSGRRHLQSALMAGRHLATSRFRTAWTQSGRSCRPTATGAVAPHRPLRRTALGRFGRKKTGPGGCYSTTSSARARTESGIVRPSAFEVFRLMINSILFAR
jgi:hypothetical protein